MSRVDHPQFVKDRARRLFADLWDLEDWEKSKPEIVEMICDAMQEVVGLSIIKLGLAENVKSMGTSDAKD
jgi:hypothetical protein